MTTEDTVMPPRPAQFRLRLRRAATRHAAHAVAGRRANGVGDGEGPTGPGIGMRALMPNTMIRIADSESEV
jgi:hypothetical protein